MQQTPHSRPPSHPAAPPAPASDPASAPASAANRLANALLVWGAAFLAATPVVVITAPTAALVAGMAIALAVTGLTVFMFVLARGVVDLVKQLNRAPQRDHLRRQHATGDHTTTGDHTPTGDLAMG